MSSKSEPGSEKIDAQNADLVCILGVNIGSGSRICTIRLVRAAASLMLERCRLFLLIALGETVFTTGTAIAAAPMTLMTLVTGTVALAGTVALWALGYGARIASSSSTSRRRATPFAPVATR